MELASLSLEDLGEMAADGNVFKDKIRTLVYHWAGVEDAPVQNGYHVPDPRPWLFLEQYLNRPFFSEDMTHIGLGYYQGQLLGQAMSEAVDKLSADIMVQLAARELFETPQYFLNTDTIDPENFTLSEDKLGGIE